MGMALYTTEHEEFRRVARDFLAREVVPNIEAWSQDKLVPRDFFRKLGEIGIIGLGIPTEFGGGGATGFLYLAVWIEEVARINVQLGGLSVHMNVVMPYVLRYGSAEQKERWLPGMATGDLLAAIAMTEPGTGSDLAGITTSAVRDGDQYIVNGAKTFITGGANADLVVVVARTSRGENRREGLSLLVVERGMPGFSVGQNLDKIGLRTQDTTELFFSDVAIPARNRIGDEGRAFEYLTSNLPQERLVIAVGAVAMARAALDTTIDYVKNRTAFGQPISSFQNTRFELASSDIELSAAEAFLERAMSAHEQDDLSASEAAKVKIFCTEVQNRIVDRCLQLHGGYGYMLEYPIARMFTDARVTKIYGGTNEVLRTIVARSLGI
jgi:acyl-CoA dehydrogenase